MGTNDLGTGVSLGTFTDDTNLDVTTFSGALANAFKTLKTNYPNTKFIYLTPLKRFVSATNNNEYTNGTNTIDTFVNRAIEICKYFDIPYIDTRKIGINSSNQANYLIDGLHPNIAGMSLLSNYIMRNLDDIVYSDRDEILMARISKLIDQKIAAANT